MTALPILGPDPRPAPPDPAELARLDALFRGLADPTRIRLLNMLAAGELCVCDLVDLTGLPQPTVSRHLAYLRRSGLVDVTRGWKFAHYRLAEPPAAGHAVHAALLTTIREAFGATPALAAERDAAAIASAARTAAPC
jgi:ArsR family transcriptional regulator